MNNQFKDKAEFNTWIHKKENLLSDDEKFIRNMQTGGLYTDEEMIEMLKSDGYTNLNDLTANGERYAIGEYTNNGWVHVHDADISHCIEHGIDVRDDKGHINVDELKSFI